MAFDITNQAHLNTLYNYATVTRGFDPLTVSADVLLSALNDPADNPSPATGGDKMTVRHLNRAVLASNVASQDQFKVQLLVEPASGYDDDISEFKADMIGLGGQLATNLTAQVRALNWAEVTFGSEIGNVWEFITLTLEDWRAARDSQ